MENTPGSKDTQNTEDRRYVNRLEEAMMDAGIRSKKELAEVAGVSYQALPKGRLPTTLLNIHTALQIADALEISLDELYGVVLENAGRYRPVKKFSRTVSRGQILRDNVEKPWLKSVVLVPSSILSRGTEEEEPRKGPGSDPEGV